MDDDTAYDKSSNAFPYLYGFYFFCSHAIMRNKFGFSPSFWQYTYGHQPV
jgi:hypothetical protein